MLGVMALGGVESLFTTLLMLAWLGVCLAVLVYVLKLFGRLVASVEKLADAAERHVQRHQAPGDPAPPQ